MDSAIEGGGWKDRGEAVVFLGTVKVLMGFFSLLMLALVGFALLRARDLTGSAAPPGTFLLVAAVYLGAGVLFVWLGIGLTLVRRWAWALALVLSWVWLIGGALGAAGGIVVLETMLGAMAGSGALPSPGLLKAIMYPLLALLFVVLPGFFVLFYSGRNVRRTFREADPAPRWTDRCPLPVLSLVLLQAAAVLFLLLYVFTPLPLPLFGAVLDGVAARVAWLALAALCAVLARGALRLQPGAWLGSLALALVMGASGLVTFLRPGGAAALYGRYGYGAVYEELMSGLFQRLMPWMYAASVALSLGYYLWLRPHFRKPAAGGQAAGG